MITEKLRQLSQGNQPQTLDELFSQSKEGMMSERVISQIQALLPQMKDKLFQELLAPLTEAIKQEIGKINVRNGQDGQDGKPGQDADEEMIVKEVVKKIFPKLEKEELEVDKIKGLREILNNFSTRITSIGSRRTKSGGGGGGDTIIAEDLSSQCDGATLAFTTTKRIGKPLLVISSQFPTILRLTTDFTASGNTLTLNSSLPFIASGQTLYFVFAEG